MTLIYSILLRSLSPIHTHTDCSYNCLLCQVSLIPSMSSSRMKPISSIIDPTYYSISSPLPSISFFHILIPLSVSQIRSISSASRITSPVPLTFAFLARSTIGHWLALNLVICFQFVTLQIDVCRGQKISLIREVKKSKNGAPNANQ